MAQALKRPYPVKRKSLPKKGLTQKERKAIQAASAVIQNATLLESKAADAIKRYADERGKHDRALATLEAQLQKAKERRDKKCGVLERSAGKLADKLHVFAEEHRDELAKRGKTVTLPTDDVFRWREDRAVLAVDEEKFFRQVHEHGLEDTFIRTTEEPNRSALRDLANAEKLEPISSVKVGNRHRFVIAPAHVPYHAEITLSDEHPRWVVVKNSEKRQ